MLTHPFLNKGSAFTREERKQLGCEALLPHRVLDLKEQVEQHYVHLQQLPNDLMKYRFLMELRQHNEVLFFRLVWEHLEEMLPCIYTPVVGEAAKQYSALCMSPRGLFLSYPDRERMEMMIKSFPQEEVAVAVVTDGERILGLGDLGCGGMTISIGKLALYTLFGGIHPSWTLPIYIDVGTNNQTLLEDPQYLGWKHPRITGKPYEAFIEQFVCALTKRYPHVLLQWEDFSKSNATPLLNHYQDQLCCFNDDIQGTAGVVVAGILAALQRMNQKMQQQRIVLFGAGSAGIGIADLLVQAMREEGTDEEEAKKKIFVLGREGLAHTHVERMDELKKRFAQKYEQLKGWEINSPNHITLSEVVRHVHPTILIGTSTVSGAFTQEIVSEMKRHVERPIIFPLSNPISKSEAHPQQLMEWTEGQALVATGSPFPSVSYAGHIYPIGQCNNMFVFPGMGLGVIASRATKVTNAMFLRAAQVLSRFAPLLKDPHGALFPTLSQVRKVSYAIAVAVGKYAIDHGMCASPPHDLEGTIEQMMWEPQYSPLQPALSPTS